MIFLAEAIYRDPLPCTRQELAQTLMPAHGDYVRRGVARGRVLMGGPKGEGDGGFLLLRGEDREELDRFLQEDPLVIHGVQTFRVTSWRPLDYPPELAELLGDAPGGDR